MIYELMYTLNSSHINYNGSDMFIGQIMNDFGFFFNVVAVEKYH